VWLSQGEEEQILERVLIVEDDALSRFGLRDLLEEGFEVLEAGNGREALALLERQRVDLVVTDLVMPEMDGIDLTRVIRERGDTKVIWCTAFDRDEFRRLARELRVDGYLVKPLDLDQLHEMISGLLGAAR
jgi:CheY-like chemotaxis protein